MSRRNLRKEIIEILYQIYIYRKNNIEISLEKIINDKDLFVSSSIKGILDNESLIIDLANKYLSDWSIDRLSLVDKAILSLSIYELMYTDTPKVVCINEAVELAKKYSDEKVIKMINATLDKLYHSQIKD